MKLNSKQAIRSTLNIEDTSISEILNSGKALLSKIQNKGQNFKGALLGLLLEIIMFPLLLVW